MIRNARKSSKYVDGEIQIFDGGSKKAHNFSKVKKTLFICDKGTLFFFLFFLIWKKTFILINLNLSNIFTIKKRKRLCEYKTFWVFVSAVWQKLKKHIFLLFLHLLFSTADQSTRITGNRSNDLQTKARISGVSSCVIWCKTSKYWGKCPRKTGAWWSSQSKLRDLN